MAADSWFTRSSPRWAGWPLAALLVLTACVSEDPPARPAPGNPGKSGNSGQSAPARPAADRPNIVFVLTDDLSWNLVQHMPRVEEMRRQGLTFTNYFVANSLCCPSRATILSGKYPHNSKVLTNEAHDRGGFAAFRDKGAERDTFATSLQRAGYRTGFMGKYLNGYSVPQKQSEGPAYVPPGWDQWNGIARGYGGNNYWMAENRRAVHYGNDPDDYLTDVLARKAGQFIDRSAHDRRPFMLEISTFGPHSPYHPAQRHRDLFPGLSAPRAPAFNEKSLDDKPRWMHGLRRLTPADTGRIDQIYRNRARVVQSVDELIGRVQSTLRERGLDRDTYLVFSSDNGFHLGEHRMPEGKTTAYDSDIRVPLIVTGPGVPAGRQAPEPALNTDLAPTFEDLGRVPARPAARDGRSLVPFLRGRPPATWRRSVLIEQHDPRPDPDDPDYPGPELRGAPTYAAVRSAAELYVEYQNGDREYYDLATDPGELRNRVRELPPERDRGFRAALRALRACAGETCRQADLT